MTAVTTVIGNLAADPEFRYGQSGVAVANFTVASTEKVFDKATNDWKDGKKLFMRCTAWRETAEHVAGSLTKGMRVIVVGKIATNEFEDKEGNKRSSIDLTVDAIGPDLRYATAAVTKAQSSGVRGGTSGGSNEEPWAPATSTVPDASGDVWNSSGNFSDETPF